MSELCRSRFEVQTILRANILAGLAALGQNGWGVMEFANASFQKSDKIVLMNLINASRVGWQSDSAGGEPFTRRDEWIEEQSWQLHFILKRTDETDDTSIVAEDIAQMMIAWFNGKGCEFFRNYGIANLVIDTESIFVYNDDSDLYQKRCVFTVKIQVPKEINWAETPLEAILPKIKPV